jgi:hypothetical protein
MKLLVKQASVAIWNCSSKSLNVYFTFMRANYQRHLDIRCPTKRFMKKIRRYMPLRDDPVQFCKGLEFWSYSVGHVPHAAPGANYQTRSSTAYPAFVQPRVRGKWNKKFILSSFLAKGNESAAPRWEHRQETSMKFFAHTAEDGQGKRLAEEKWRPLSAHLGNVALLAKEFAAPPRTCRGR